MLKLGWVYVVAIAVIANNAGVLGQQTTTAPKTSGAGSVDYVRDLIDLYFQGRERDRFFGAAGVDGELSKEEFAAAAGRPHSFVRPYDRWASAVAFDRNGNGRLGWVEAEQYRLAVRRKVLALFDKDKDGRLTGTEREAANAYLAAGMGRPRVTGRTSPKPGPTTRPVGVDVWGGSVDLGSPGDPAWQKRWEQVLAKYDADKDGKLSADEGRRLQRALRRHYRSRMLKQFDKNHDGVLDAAEHHEAEMQQRREAQRWRRQWELAQWDTDKDGRLDKSEQAAMDRYLAERRRKAQRRREEWIKRWDRNGDGEVSRDEWAVATREIRHRVALQRKQMDTDGDGKITAQEIRAYRKKLFDELRRRRQRDREAENEN